MSEIEAAEKRWDDFCETLFSSVQCSHCINAKKKMLDEFDDYETEHKRVKRVRGRHRALMARYGGYSEAQRTLINLKKEIKHG